MTVHLAVLALWVAAAAPPPDLPEPRRLLDGLAERQRQFEAVLNDYTYDLDVVSEQLDRKGAVSSRKSRRYEIFFVKRKRVRRLVAEDGRPLSAERQAKVDADVRKYVDEVLQGKARPPQHDGFELSEVLDRYEFRSVARETVDGRPAILLEFTPLPGKRDLKGDVILRRLAGRIWVDEAERVVMRAEIRSIGSIKVALGLGASISAVEVLSEFTKVEDGVWLPRRVETLVWGRVLLLKGIHERTTNTFSGHRRFAAEWRESPTLPKP